MAVNGSSDPEALASALDRWLGGDRQREVKRAAEPDVAFHPDAAVVGFDDSLRDRESEPDPTAVRRFRLPEAPENVWKLLGRDARSGVDDRESYFTLETLGANGDAAISRGELHRVADKVGQHLLNPCRVGDNRRQKLLDVG